MGNENQEADNERQNHKNWHRHERLRDKIDRLHRAQFGQRGFLRPQIIQLFEKGPMNGVDIMNRLQDESHGWYRPSPGSIYPLLEQLEKEGLISKNNEGKFELTAAYGDRFGVNDDLSVAISSLESNVSYLEDLCKGDKPRLSKNKERVEKLAKRLQALDASLQSGSGSP